MVILLLLFYHHCYINIHIYILIFVNKDYFVKILRYQLTLKIQEDDIRSDYVQNNPELLKKIEADAKAKNRSFAESFNKLYPPSALVAGITDSLDNINKETERLAQLKQELRAS